jgi:hypothetical protein
MKLIGKVNGTKNYDKVLKEKNIHEHTLFPTWKVVRFFTNIVHHSGDLSMQYP